MLSKRQYIKAKKLLKSMLNRNFWAFLFFLALSASFWLFLTLEEEYDIQVKIPVELTNVPKNVVITTPPTQQITVTLHDRGTALIGLWHTHQFDTIRINFYDYNKYSGHVSLLTNDIAQNTLNKIGGTTKVVSIKPDTLEYFYNYGLNATVPIRLNGKITPDSLYAVGDTTIRPAVAQVYASREILDTLTEVWTKPLVLNKLNRSESHTVDLAPIKGVKIVPSRVKVTVDADFMIENTVQVPIEYINFPAGKTLKTFPGIVSVTFQVGMKRYRQITADKFAIVVTYDEVIQANNHPLRLSLKNQPKGVSHVRIVPEEVEYLIEDSSEN